MTYQDTLNWMFQQLPMYQNKGRSAYKKDLTNALKLDEHLGHPHQKFKTIHVAGTNGKGSTSHMLASILQQSGYSVGLYTSPHLKDFRERIRVNGTSIKKRDVVDFISKNKTFLEERELSFFEMTVGMAFDYFTKKAVDIAVIEVGLGGRLDSTNIITPILSVITNIGYDHVAILGDTLEKIAFEKAGIIKPNVPVIIGEIRKETKAVFLEKAMQTNAPISFAEDYTFSDYKSDLKGSYQKRNIITVLAAIKTLRDLGLKIYDNQIKKGLLNVVVNTGLLGRWQVLGHNPKIICDTAHNREGLEYIVSQLMDEKYDHLHIVYGSVNDKNLDTVLDILPKSATYYFCKPKVQRGMDEVELASKFLEKGFSGSFYSSVEQAYNEAKSRAKETDLIFIGGSTFVVAEVL